jgi:hypothetical protein
MGYKNSDLCIQKAFDDERLFVLMARDKTAPEVVRFWATINKDIQPEWKIKEALDCANEMERNCAEFNDRKLKN